MVKLWNSHKDIDEIKDACSEDNGTQHHTKPGQDVEQNVTSRAQQENMVQSVQNLEAIINEGLRVALLEKSPDQSLEVLLAYLGKALSGERTYIFEKNEYGGDDNTYEWTASGVRPEKENLQNVPPELCESWYRKFSVGKHIVIKDIEEIRQSEPQQYETLKKQNVHTLVVVPLYDDDDIIGFYGVDNPPVQSLDYTSNMLQITAHFIVSSLRRRNLIRQLQEQSYDVLRSLNVDYVAIYQVDFDTDQCHVYRENKRPKGRHAMDFKTSYETAMEEYISQYVVPQDQERLRTVTKKCHVLSQLKTKKKFYVRYQVKDNRHGAKNVELHFSTTGKDSEVNKAIFAFRNVNSIVEQEEKYKLEIQQNMETILEGSKTGIWSIEMEDNCPPRLYADRTMRRLLGVSEDVSPEECYQYWLQNIDPDYVEMVLGSMQEMLRHERAEVAYPWNHPEQGKVYVRCGGMSDHNFAKPGICVKGYHQDITETMVMRQEHAKTIVEALGKVKQANSAKAEFLSHMSHDIRTPINGIMGMLDIIDKNPDDMEKQKECRTKIRMAANHLLSLINDVLDITELESGHADMVEEAFDLREILKNCMAILGPKAEEFGVQIEMPEIDVDHSSLIGSSHYLRQIFVNVVSNAVKYNKPGGNVYIKIKELPVHRENFAEYHFTVEDTGIGMSEEFLSQIFEPFTQEQHHARTNYSGTGLGMAITKKLVDQMGGTIEVESQPGEGSRFQIVLPLQINETQLPQATEEEDDEPADISGMRVLIVEDNPLNSEILQYMLEDAGAEVITAENGQEAVDIFTDAEPDSIDCILMDLMMPIMNGLDATRTIRSMDRPDAETVPIIALSANSFYEDTKQSQEAGMNEHMAKPVDMDKLFKLMHRLTNRNK